MTVPPNSGSFIPVRIPGAEHLAEPGLVEPTLDINKAFIVLGLVNLNRNDVSINVLNTTTDPVYANQQVGNCVSFTESAKKISVCTRAVHSDSSNNGGASVPDYLVDLLERSSVHLDGEQVKVLQNLLLEYKDVFSKSSDDIGRTSLTEHRINTGTAFPIRQPGRRIPIGKKEMVREELQKMIERGMLNLPVALGPQM